MARVLITGAKGGIGSILAARLRQSGLSLQPAFPGPVEVVDLGREELDITRREQLEAAFGKHRPEIVLNAAGVTEVDRCESYQWEAFLVNRDGADHLGRVCARHKAFLVYLSTDLVFDGTKRAPYTEEDPPSPLSVYADTKLAGELAVMSAAPKHLILRTGWVFGQPGRHLLRALQKGLRDDEILFAHDAQVGQPTYVQDLVDALIFLLSRGLTGTYHAAGAGEATQLQVVKRALQLVERRGVQVRAIRDPGDGRLAMRPSYSVLSCAKLERAGFKMRPWEAALLEFTRTLVGVRT